MPEPNPSTRADELRAQILQLTREYHEAAFPEREFVAGDSSVPVSGRVFDDDDLAHLVDSSLDFWLTTGRFAHQFERRFAKVFGRRHCILVNSGSSANLVAFSALTSHKLGHRRVKPGDEVITVATGFPTRSTRPSSTARSRCSSTSTCRPTTSTSPTSRTR